MTRLTIDELLRRSRAELDRVNASEAAAAMGQGASLIDIRGDDQRRTHGVVPGALVIARNVLEWRLDPDSEHRHPQAPGLDEPVIIMCQEGYQSSLAASTLHRLGFSRATDLDGGFEAWQAAGLPTTRD